MQLPAFAARVEVGLPTGVNSKGIDTEVTGVMTRSVGRWRTHLNVGYTFLGSPQQNERPGIYRLVAAVSYPLGYPMSLRDTIIANVFTRQSDVHGQRNPTGIGIGLRHQVSSRVVFDAGMGTEFYGPADRSVFFTHYRVISRVLNVTCGLFEGATRASTTTLSEALPACPSLTVRHKTYDPATSGVSGPRGVRSIQGRRAALGS